MNRPATLNTNSLRVALGRRLEVQTLRLSRESLETLPEGILNMPNLECLHIEVNPFKDLDAVVAQLQALPKLRELRIDTDANGLWPKGLDKLPHLETLALQGPIMGRQPDCVAGMTGLKALHYYVSNWAGDPSRFGPLTQAASLEEIWMYFNGPMPEGLGVLKQVKRLRVMGPGLVPDDVCEMEGLEELQLLAIHHSGKIHQLPAAFGKLQRLRNLKLKDQMLTQFPSSFSDLRALEVLEMHNNPLTGIPAELAGLQLLRELDFSENPIQTVPDWMGDLPALQKLDLTKTKVGKLPAQLDRCKDLTTLLLDDCAFKEFPEVTLSCPALATLSLRGNKIASLPLSAAKVQQTLLIDLARNKVEQMPWQIAEAPRLTVNLENNPVAKTSGYKLDRTLVYVGEDKEQLGTSPGARHAMYALALNDLQLAAQKATQGELIGFLNASDNTIRGRALELLSRQIPNPFEGEDLPDKLALLGKATTLKPTELKKLAQEKGFQLLPATDPAVQVIVLGEKPGLDCLQSSPAPQPALATPSHFQTFLDRLTGAWVKKAAAQSPQVTGNLLALLASKNPTNLAVAFTMMSQGGMPAEAASAVLSLSWWAPDEKTRKAATQLWQQHASSEAKAYLLARKRNASAMKPDKLQAYLEDLAALPDFDLEVLVRFADLYKSGGA